MIYPDITLVPGYDLIEIASKLRRLDVTTRNLDGSLYIYGNFDESAFETRCKLVANSFSWGKNQFCMYELQEGMDLVLFKSRNIKLIHFPVKLWACEHWELDMTFDLQHWHTQTIFSNEHKLALNNIFCYCVYYEQELLNLYIKSLLPTFKHPDINRMLNWCISRKVSHIKIWNKAKEQLKLPSINIESNKKFRSTAINLNHVIKDLTECISFEEIKETAAVLCLTYFSNRGHLVEVVDAVKRRNQESQEHSIILTTLLSEVNRQYPFLKEDISNFLKINKQNANFLQTNFYELPNLTMFSKTNIV